MGLNVSITIVSISEDRSSSVLTCPRDCFATQTLLNTGRCLGLYLRGHDSYTYIIITLIAIVYQSLTEQGLLAKRVFEDDIPLPLNRLHLMTPTPDS